MDKLNDFYVYALALSNERVPLENSLRVTLEEWTTIRDVSSQYVVYIGISRLMPSRRLSKHHSKKIYNKIAKALNMDIESQNLVMHVLSEYMGYTINEWPLVASIEASLIQDFKQQHGHEPILQVPAPDSGIKKVEWLKMKKELGLKIAQFHKGLLVKL